MAGTLAAAVMADDRASVTGVPGDPDPAKLLDDYKAYASRIMNRQWGKPASDTWWTAGGSRRILKSQRRLVAAIRYVVNQSRPLWRSINPKYQVLFV